MTQPQNPNGYAKAIEHDEARELLQNCCARPASEKTAERFARLGLYVAQQEARSSELEAVRLELERTQLSRDTLHDDYWSRVGQCKELEAALATERARAEEQQREWPRLHKANSEDLLRAWAELAAANARAASLEEPALVLARWYLGRWPGSTNAEGLAAKSIIAHPVGTCIGCKTKRCALLSAPYCCKLCRERNSDEPAQPAPGGPERCEHRRLTRQCECLDCGKECDCGAERTEVHKPTCPLADPTPAEPQGGDSGDEGPTWEEADALSKLVNCGTFLLPNQPGKRRARREECTICNAFGGEPCRDSRGEQLGNTLHWIPDESTAPQASTEQVEPVSGRLRWPGGAELTLCLVPWHKVLELNGPCQATADDLREFGWLPAHAPAPAEPQGRPEQAGDRPVMLSELVAALRDGARVAVGLTPAEALVATSQRLEGGK